MDLSVILSEQASSSRSPGSERRASWGWAATHLSTLHPEQEQPFSTQATELRPAFSLLPIQVCPAQMCLYPQSTLGPGCRSQPRTAGLILKMSLDYGGGTFFI